MSTSLASLNVNFPGTNPFFPTAEIILFNVSLYARLDKSTISFSMFTIIERRQLTYSSKRRTYSSNIFICTIKITRNIVFLIAASAFLLSSKFSSLMFMQIVHACSKSYIIPTKHINISSDINNAFKKSGLLIPKSRWSVYFINASNISSPTASAKISSVNLSSESSIICLSLFFISACSVTLDE